MSARLTEQVLDGAGVERVLVRLAHEICDRVDAEQLGPRRLDPNSLALVGIRTGGAHLAERLAKHIAAVRDQEVPVGLLDITLYRDDVLVGSPGGRVPVLRDTEVTFDVEGRYLVLVDDVLFTGRTVRAGLGALLDLGRPGCVRLAVLIDRGLRELPVAADFVGREIPSEPDDHVEVQLTEEGHDEDRVFISRPTNRRASDDGEAS